MRKRVVVSRLVGLAVVAAALWSGWWLIAARGTDAGYRAWLADRRAAGWLAEAEAISVTGYPRDFVVAIQALDLADPATGLAWSAPSFRLQSPAWDPTDVTAVFPSRQVVATPQERIEIAADRMRARLALVPGPALTLRRAEIVLDRAALSSTLGWQAGLSRVRLSLARAEGDGNRYDLAFEAAEYTPAAPFLNLVDPGGALPRTIDLLSIDARLGFDAPWDRSALEQRRPQPRRLDLDRLKARWGRLELEAAGALTIAPDGVATGEIHLRIVNWRDLLALGVAAGLVPENLAGGIETGLELLAAAGGNPTTLEAPLGFRDGQVTLGPVPLGPVPRIVLR